MMVHTFSIPRKRPSKVAIEVTHLHVVQLRFTVCSANALAVQANVDTA